MKIFLKIMVWSLLLPFTVLGQVSPEVAKKFSANVVSRIYEITSKVSLP